MTGLDELLSAASSASAPLLLPYDLEDYKRIAERMGLWSGKG